MAGGRPCQLSRSDWSFQSHSSRPSGPSPAWVFIALLLHNTPKFGHHSLSSIKGGCLALHQNAKWSVTGRCLSHRSMDHKATIWVAASLEFCFQHWTLEKSSPSYASQRERWRSSKRSTGPCLTVFMWAIDLRRRIFQTLLQFWPYKVLLFPQLIPNSRVTN